MTDTLNKTTERRRGQDSVPSSAGSSAGRAGSADMEEGEEKQLEPDLLQEGSPPHVFTHRVAQHKQQASNQSKGQISLGEGVLLFLNQPFMEISCEGYCSAPVPVLRERNLLRPTGQQHILHRLHGERGESWRSPRMTSLTARRSRLPMTFSPDAKHCDDTEVS